MAAALDLEGVWVLSLRTSEALVGVVDRGSEILGTAVVSAAERVELGRFELVTSLMVMEGRRGRGRGRRGGEGEEGEREGKEGEGGEQEGEGDRDGGQISLLVGDICPRVIVVVSSGCSIR